MKYKLSVRIFLTYRDKDVKVEVELSDEEVARIKELVAKDLEEQKQVDGDDEDGEDDFVSPPDLLDILDRKSPELFDLLWDVIFPKVFVESLIDGIKNYGELVRHEDDHYRSHRKVSFDNCMKCMAMIWKLIITTIAYAKYLGVGCLRIPNDVFQKNTVILSVSAK